MYRCLNCGKLHMTEDDLGVGRERMCRINGVPYYEYFSVCPECGSDEIEEYKELDIGDLVTDYLEEIVGTIMDIIYYPNESVDYYKVKWENGNITTESRKMIFIA